MPAFSRLAIMGVGVALAKEVANCQDGATCASQLEDDSLMQLGRLGVNADPTSASSRRKSFIENSMPYLGKEGKSTDGHEGRLLINEDGEMNTYYLPGATVIDDGLTVEYRPPYRFYLMNKYTTDYSNAEDFYFPKFIGKTFSVDIDFKRDGPACGCNLNFYLVSMPWPTEGKDHDYYCDAQCFDGLGCCHEFDMNEGNKEVQQMTNHACTGNYAGHPDWACHKWGDPETKSHAADFSPGAGATIDSNKPFTYAQRFDKNGDDFTFTTILSQEGREVVYKMGPGSGELNNMLQEIEKGMAFVTGYWFAADMNWMDGEECGAGSEHCNMNPAYISNWRLTTNDGPAPAPPPPGPPGPGPAPAPPSGDGRCCWSGGCSGCNNDPHNFCNQGSDNCASCSGEWCPY